jgi:hypothetical protein
MRHIQILQRLPALRTYGVPFISRIISQLEHAQKMLIPHLRAQLKLEIADLSRKTRHTCSYVQRVTVAQLEGT